MKPTKQQAICLKLAQWLEYENVRLTESQVYLWQVTYGDGGHWNYVFNPFSTSTDGRAQFAECVIKALRECSNLRIQYGRISLEKGGKEFNAFDFTAGEQFAVPLILEGIYLAIGGEPEWEAAHAQ